MIGGIKMLEYKGFYGMVEYDQDVKVFYGNVINVDEILSFRGKDADSLEKSFRNLVDIYIADCKKEGKAPYKPYNGRILVRTNPDLHRRVALLAASKRTSMNDLIENTLEQLTSDDQHGIHTSKLRRSPAELKRSAAVRGIRNTVIRKKTRHKSQQSRPFAP